MTWFYLALASAVIWGISAILQKDASHGEHAIQFVAASSLISGVGALMFLPFIGISDLDALSLALILGASLIGGTSYYLGGKGFKYLSLSEASPLYNIGTVIAIVLAVVFLNEKLTPLQLIGVILIISGTYVLELKGRNPFGPFIRIFKSEKIHFVLIATILSSVLAVYTKIALNYVEPKLFLVGSLLLTAVYMQGVLFLRHNGLKDLKKGFTVHKKAVFLIGLLTLLGMFTDIYALKLGEVALFLPVMRTWTLIAVLFGGAFLKENHIRNRIVATIIMLVGVFIIYI